MSVGSKTRTLRKSKYMTLQDVSNITKLSIDTISRFERNRSNYTINTITQIAKALGVSVEELKK